jgi:hypothetical protein
MRSMRIVAAPWYRWLSAVAPTSLALHDLS